jgi:putative ABC transport system permease protein
MFSDRVKGWRKRLRNVLRRNAVEREFDAELAFHIRMEEQKNRREGMNPTSARRAALLALGGVERTKEAVRDVWSFAWLEDLLRDLRLAFRSLRRTPGFTAAAVLILALGIGATTSVFSVLKAVVLARLPFPNAERIVVVREDWKGQAGYVSAGNYGELRRAHAFQAMAAVGHASFNLDVDDEPERVLGARVTRDFFAVFGTPPAIGRTFTAEEGEPGSGRVVVLSHALWQRRFGGGPVLGRIVRLSDEPYTIVGVMPAAFDLQGVCTPCYAQGTAQLWIPAAFTAADYARYDGHSYVVFGRLRSGVVIGRANAEIADIMAQAAARVPEDADRTARAKPLKADVVGDYDSRLWLLFGSVTLVLLIACANIAGMLLVRGTTRRREITVRAALGACRRRIARELLTEAVLLAIIGGVAGVLFAYWGVSALVALAPPGVPRIEQAGVDARALAFALLLSAACGIGFGLAPALRSGRERLESLLRDGGRGLVGAARDRTRSAVVVLEVALAIALLVGAGLLIRTGIMLARTERGFEPRGVLTARVALPRDALDTGPAALRAFDLIEKALRAVPGVAAVGFSSQVPLGPGWVRTWVAHPDAAESDQDLEVRLRVISPDYLRAVGTSLLAGRTFDEHDTEEGVRVALVSRELARRLWPGQDPVGQRFICCHRPRPGESSLTVVGVVHDTRSEGLDRDIVSELYIPVAQMPAAGWRDMLQGTLTLAARAENGDAASLLTAVRSTIHGSSPGAVVYDVQSLTERLRGSLADERFNTLLLVTLALIGLILAAVGVYGVTAYHVASGTGEFGLRLALGAAPGNILVLAARHSLLPIGLGAAIGFLAGLGAGRVLAASIHGVATWDPATHAVVLLIVGATTGLAIYLPARRATRINPVEALRAE